MKNKNREDFYENYVNDDLEIVLPKEAVDNIINSELGYSSLYYKLLGILKDNTYQITDTFKAHVEILFKKMPNLDLQNQWDGRLRRSTESNKIISENLDNIKNDEDLFVIYKNMDIFASIDDCRYDLSKYNHAIELSNKINNLLNII
jgi:hypothetical protein